MKEKKHRYPTLDGKTTLTLNDRTLTLTFEDRSVTLMVDDSDLETVLPRMGLKTKDLGEIRRLSKMVSHLGVTLRLRDSRGVVFSLGKGVWTPLGHFSFRPRIRKYVGGER